MFELSEEKKRKKKIFRLFIPILTLPWSARKHLVLPRTNPKCAEVLISVAPISS